MRLNLAERMRCPRAHRPTPLIVVARAKLERDLVAGVAGCPECYLEARIEEGDVEFPGAVRGDAGREAPPSDESTAERVIALLGLAEPGGAVLLSGHYARLAAQITARVDVAVVALNAAPSAGDGINAVWLTEPAVPFTDGTFRAVALDATLAATTAADALRTVAAGGRVLGALPLERPVGVRELARDATEWVGEKESGASGVIPLRRA